MMHTIKLSMIFRAANLLLLLISAAAVARTPAAAVERVFETTFESAKRYSDPFNDLDVDVVFSKAGQSWRVPTFWRGGSRWTVRFAPPAPGTYTYRLESTDRGNPDLNGHQGRVVITAYTGGNTFLRRGMLQVSPNGRYFDQADGTPFFWLGETWYSGLSTRLSWEGFQKLAADRKAKGFTVIEVCAGLSASNEELAPVDPPFRNEGGPVWDPEFKQINPKYFDYADRRIQHLIDAGMAPAIIGGWRQVLSKMGVAKMKQHWRYIIARYGAYPVFWIGGGEIYDPPPGQRKPGIPYGATYYDLSAPGWTEVVRYIRATDPYHHPLTVHEIDPPFDTPLQDELLKDFELFQAGHRGWPSLATAIAQLNLHYARTTVTKPLVVGEIGYEGLGATHFEDFQRAAFWLSLLNGAAGFSYSTVETTMFPTPDQQFSRTKYSFLSWEETMTYPGSYEVGLGAKLLQSYPWWEFAPHPEWVTPSGTTLLAPNSKVSGFDLDLISALAQKEPPPDDDLPLGEWHSHHGNWRLPYAAGVAGKVRFTYLPYFGFKEYPTPVVHGLEPGVRYHAYYWQPALGIKVGLGVIERGAGNASGKVDLPRGDRKLYDARGAYRGELRGPVWDDYGTHQRVDGDTYQPENPPTIGDWVLILEALT
jgi:hypothetical protein